MDNNGITLEELYNLQKHEVQATRVRTSVTKKVLEVFPNPNPERNYRVEIEFPEFTCLCPKTSQPDFAYITLKYIPDKVCVELKSLKYYLQSFRNEGHFHEKVSNILYDDLKSILDPRKLSIEASFNVRGGTYPFIVVGDEL